MIEESEKKLYRLIDACRVHYYDVIKPLNGEQFEDRLEKVRKSKGKSMQNLLEEISREVAHTEEFVRR